MNLELELEKSFLEFEETGWLEDSSALLGSLLADCCSKAFADSCFGIENLALSYTMCN